MCCGFRTDIKLTFLIIRFYLPFEYKAHQKNSCKPGIGFWKKLIKSKVYATYQDPKELLKINGLNYINKCDYYDQLNCCEWQFKVKANATSFMKMRWSQKKTHAYTRFHSVWCWQQWLNTLNFCCVFYVSSSSFKPNGFGF